MATREAFKQIELKQRRNRYFSEEFKRSKVNELDKNLVTIAELSREYNVSKNAIYQWIYKYSRMRKKEERQVYETLSDTRKLKELQDRVKELERIVGLKQLKIDFLEEVIDRTERTYSVDVKKKFIEKHLDLPGMKEDSETKNKNEGTL